MNNNDPKNIKTSESGSFSFKCPLPVEYPGSNPGIPSENTTKEMNTNTAFQTDEKSTLEGLFMLMACNSLEKKFLQERNGLLAWQQYVLARDNNTCVPEWVLQYFDSVAGNLKKIFDGAPEVKGDRISNKIAWATGLDGGRKAFNELWLEFRDREICFNAWIQINLEGSTTEETFVSVSDQVGIGADSVKRVYYEYKSEIDELAKVFLKNCSDK